MRKLTIGMATHDDYDGLYFSIQNIRMNHREVLDDIEFVIIDNNPYGVHGESIRKFIKWVKEPIQYLPFNNYQSTCVKNKVFALADTPYVLCMDSHVLIEPKSLKKLIKFYDQDKDEGNLLQGPLLYDDMQSISTHFDLSQWGNYMWGQWGNDDRGNSLKGEAFEIPAQGMGLFSARKDSWLRFNPLFRGFGGEEGYIHEKYRKNGKKTLCLPFLRWMHRFERPNGANYPNNLLDRFRNYYIGFKELELDMAPLLEHFKEVATTENILKIEKELLNVPQF
jgi:hypothetical protein